MNCKGRRGTGSPKGAGVCILEGLFLGSLGRRDLEKLHFILSVFLECLLYTRDGPKAEIWWWRHIKSTELVFSAGKMRS